jgi:hypothetical protein
VTRAAVLWVGIGSAVAVHLASQRTPSMVLVTLFDSPVEVGGTTPVPSGALAAAEPLRLARQHHR